MTGSLLDVSAVNLFGERIAEIAIKPPASRGNRQGTKSQFETQLSGNDPGFARIYGFSFEGDYYHLPYPVFFLVHGDGEPVTPGGTGTSQQARAPRQPEVSGTGSADYEFSDDIRFWTYDRDDFSLRMDVETGSLDDILIDPFLGGPGGIAAAGQNARGQNARGQNARGQNARGQNARGQNARGQNARGGNSD